MNHLPIQEIIELAALQKMRRTKTKIKLDPKNKPIMSATLEGEVEAALVQYEQHGLWKEWGMDYLREQGACVLFAGPPGTGKTVIAKYMSKRVGRGFAALNMKDVGGKAPGQTERMVAEVFMNAKQKGNQTIFMDECEAILWDRGRAGSDSMWMVGIIDEILMQIASYKGLVVLATNRMEIVDTALLSRCFAVLQIGMPEHPERLRLWKQKLPDRFPFKPTAVQLDHLAEAALSGREIELAIVKEASNAMVQKRNPNYASLMAMAKSLVVKH